MRIYLAIAAAAALTSTIAVEQPANRDANTPAVNAPNSPPNPGAPVAGANSFTEGQAKSRIEARGYTNVAGLTKDGDGVWRPFEPGKLYTITLQTDGGLIINSEPLKGIYSEALKRSAEAKALP